MTVISNLLLYLTLFLALRTNSFHIDEGGKTNQLSFELQCIGEPKGKTKV